MRTRWATVLVLAWVSLPGAALLSQTIYSLTSGSGFPVVAIDPATGVVQPLVNTNAPDAAFGLSTLDVAGRRLFFLSGSAGSQVLFIVNLQDRTVASVPIPNPFSYVFFEFDPPSGKILSLTSGPGFPVVSIDPATGVVQPLVNTNAPDASGGFSALDVAGRRLFFLSGSAGSQVLFTVNVQTRTVSSVPIPNPFLYLFFEFDPTSGKILSVSSGPGTPVVTIDPGTGAVQPLVNTNAAGVAFETSALDVVGRRLFFLAGSVGSQVLFTVNVQTRTVTTVSIPSPVLYIFFEFDPTAAAIPIPIDRTALIALVCGLAAIGCRMLRR